MRSAPTHRGKRAAGSQPSPRTRPSPRGTRTRRRATPRARTRRARRARRESSHRFGAPRRHEPVRGLDRGHHLIRELGKGSLRASAKARDSRVQAHRRPGRQAVAPVTHGHARHGRAHPLCCRGDVKGMLGQVDHVYDGRPASARAEKDLAPAQINATHLPHRPSRRRLSLSSLRHEGASRETRQGLVTRTTAEAFGEPCRTPRKMSAPFRPFPDRMVG